MEQFSYLVGNSGIVFTHDNKSFVLPKNTEGYFKAMGLLQEDKASSQAFIDLFNEQERKAQSVFGSVVLTENIRLDSGILYFKDYPLRLSIAERILSLMKEGFTPKPMLNFLERLMNNPDPEVVQDLYDFMEKGNIPVTFEGFIVCYRAVTSDFKDIYTKTMDNSIGAEVSMPRWMVKKDRNVTCAPGLHACSFEYLPHFAHADGKVVEVLIDPADVVSIPTDYNNAKMRVCRFKVIKENTTFYQQHPECILSKSTFYADRKYQVVVNHGDGELFEVVYGSEEEPEAMAYWEKVKKSAYRSTLHVDGVSRFEVFTNEDFTPEESTGFTVSHGDTEDNTDPEVSEPDSYLVKCYVRDSEGYFNEGAVLEYEDESEARSEAARLAMDEYYKVVVIRESDGEEVCSLSGVLRLKD